MRLCTRTSCEADSEDIRARLDVGELEGYAGEGDLVGGGDERVGAGGGADGVYGLLLRGEEEQGSDRGGEAGITELLPRVVGGVILTAAAL